MPYPSGWVNPSAGGALDLSTGSTISETWVDSVASNLLVLGGTTGQIYEYAFASGTVNNPTTNSPTTVSLDPSVTLTPSSGGTIFAMGCATFTHNTATAVIGLAISCSGLAESPAFVVSPPTTTGSFMAYAMWRWLGTSAGTYALSLRWFTNVGIATSIGTNRALLAWHVRGT